MTTVTKADIEHQLVFWLSNDGFHDRPVPFVRKAIVAAAGIITEALGLEDSEDDEELEGLIAFTRQCSKVRECDRMDLTSSVGALMTNDVVSALSNEGRQRLAARLTDSLAELTRS